MEKEEKTKVNYFNDFIEMLENHPTNRGFKTGGEFNIFSHLIKLMGEESFNLEMECCFLNEDDDIEFDNGYFTFHKSMRQTDFFDIGEGHLDMIFWNFLHVSEIPYKMLKQYINRFKE